MIRTLRAVIADDEPPARRKLIRLLEAHPDVRIAGEAGTGKEAVKLIRDAGPDIVFLDVQMPGLDGFDVLDLLGETAAAVIFVTAFEEYAVRAFEVRAFDYLVKPVTPERLASALDRIRASAPSPPPPEAAPGFWKRLLVQGPRVATFVTVDEIDWIESARNYAVLHCAGSEHVIRLTLETIAARLDPDKFARINRSTIVNLDRVKELHPWSHGEYKVILNSGPEFTWSRRFQAQSLTRFLAGS